MKKYIGLLTALLLLVCFLTACSKETRGKSAYEVAVDNGFEGTEEEWLNELKGEDGEDGKDGIDGTNGMRGKDGENNDLTVEEFYRASGFDGTLEQFIDSHMIVNVPKENVRSVSENLLASVSVVVDEDTAGSGILYRVDKENGDAYVITEYAVVSDGDNIGEIQIYLYGGEGESGAIEAQYLCGSQTYDIAVLMIKNSEILKNSCARAVTFANSNDIAVGQTAIAIGNLNGGGLTVTTGIVGSESENISLLDLKTMEESTYRAICTDCITSGGSGGGGLFDAYGRMIGMLNARLILSDSAGLGYALPSNVVKNVVENLLYYYENEGETAVKKSILGITVSESSSKAVYDEIMGRTYTIATITVTNVVSEGEQAVASGHIFAGDVIKRMEVLPKDGSVWQGYDVTRSYVIVDVMLTVRAGDTIRFLVEREKEGVKTDETVELTIDKKSLVECK